MAVAHRSFGFWAILETLVTTILCYYTYAITKEEYSSSRFSYEASK